MRGSPLNVGASLLCVGVPLVVYPVALLNGGSGVCCDACLRIGFSLSYCPVPLVLLRLSSVLCVVVCAVLLLCCAVRYCGVVMCGVVVFRYERLYLSFLFFSLCSLLQRCWLVWCLCDRVVSLWNSGDGLCWAEGRVVSTVCTSPMLCCVSCCVVCCGMAVV